MKSAKPGSGISDSQTVRGVEVINISLKGLRLSLGSEELFLPFTDFPWFQHAAVDKVLNVEAPSTGHLYWPDLDIDLDVDSIRNPQKYPLVSRTGSGFKD